MFQLMLKITVLAILGSLLRNPPRDPAEHPERPVYCDKCGAEKKNGVCPNALDADHQGG